MSPSYKSLAVVGAAFAALCAAAFHGVTGANAALLSAAALLVTWFAQPPSGGGGTPTRAPFDLPKQEPTLDAAMGYPAPVVALLATCMVASACGASPYQLAAVYQAQLMACVHDSQTANESRECRHRVMRAHGRPVDAGAP